MTLWNCDFCTWVNGTIRKKKGKNSENILGFFQFYKSVLICHFFCPLECHLHMFFLLYSPHTLSVLGQVFISLYQGNHNNSQDALPTPPPSSIHSMATIMDICIWMSHKSIILNKFRTKFIIHLFLSKAVYFLQLNDVLINLIFQVGDLDNGVFATAKCAPLSHSESCNSLTVAFRGMFLPQKLADHNIWHFWILFLFIREQGYRHITLRAYPPWQFCSFPNASQLCQDFKDF